MEYRKLAARPASGFTLIELMVVIIIVAVLIGVALPAYQNQTLRTNRAAAKGEMLKIADLQKQFLLANRSFADNATLEANGFALSAGVGEKYDYGITLGTATYPSFIITFTPKSGNFQEKDGPLTLTSEGEGGPPEKWAR